MKKIFTLLGIEVLLVLGCLILFGSVNVNAQLVHYPTPSNLKIVMYSNSVAPLDCNSQNNSLIDWVGNHIQNLIQINENSPSNLLANGFCSFPINSPQTGIAQSSYFSGKFYFDGISDVGIDTGLILGTGTVKTWCHLPNSILNGLQMQNPGIIYPSIYNSGAGNGSGTFQNGGNGWEPYNTPTWVQRDIQYPELVALNGGDSIWDANVMEFDFVPKGNFISLDYVFASEEWPNFHCSGRGADVMGIFLSGPGIVGQKNIATLPGSTTPVTTQTVFPAGSSCHPEAPAGSPWYVDNTGGQNIIFNGFTKVLRAASIVQPCQTYHLKIMVADGVQHPYDSMFIKSASPNPVDSSNVIIRQGLMMYDSGVLLKMRSLRSMDTVKLEALGGLSLSAAYPFAMRGCFNGKFRLSVSDSLPVARTFTLNYSGSALSGVDYQALPSTVTLPAFAKSVLVPVTVLNNGQTNTRQLVVKVQSPYGTCLPGYQQYLDTAILNIVSQYPVTVNPDDTLICVGCQVQLQTEVEPGINYTYAWSPGLSLSNTSIGNPIAAPNVSTAYSVTVTGSNSFSNCAVGSATAQVNIGNVGIKDQEIDKESLKIYPNATKDGKVQISLANGNTAAVYSMTIYTAEGKLSEQKSGTLLELNTVLSSQTFSSGSYRMIVQDKAGNRFLGNFVVL